MHFGKMMMEDEEGPANVSSAVADAATATAPTAAVPMEPAEVIAARQKFLAKLAEFLTANDKMYRKAPVMRNKGNKLNKPS